MASAVLFVMRTADLIRTHPQADYSHECSACCAPVAIYPSGQEVIRGFAPGDVELVCNVCAGDIWKTGQPLPGTFSEMLESKEVKRKP